MNKEMNLRFALLAVVAVWLFFQPASAVIPINSGPDGGFDSTSLLRNVCRDVAMGRVVRLRGVVTLAQGTLPHHQPVFYLEDEGGGVSVQGEANLGLRVGEVVEVEGRTACLDGLEPEVQNAVVVRTGAKAKVTPLHLSPQQAQLTSQIGRLVRVYGEVTKTSVGDERDRIVIRDGGSSLVCYVRRRLEQAPVLTHLAEIGAQVEVQGILVPSSDGVNVLRLRDAADLVLLAAPRPVWLRAMLIGAIAIGLGALAAAVWILTMRRAIRKQTIEIRHLLHKAQEASRLKSEILANVSHEIRTPIHGILGLQTMLLDSELDAEQRTHLAAALEATRSLQCLLDDVLDLSRIEAGRMAMVEEPFDPAELVQSVSRASSGQAIQKGLAMGCASFVSPGRRVWGDPHRTRQVLLNLAGNAVKFTDRGSVSLLLSEEVLDDARTRLVYSVRDTGIGISQEEMPVIFDTFRQADGSISRRHGGSGLGLAIAQKLAVLMGGTLQVESQPGQGSTFSFHVVCRVAPETSRAATEGGPATGVAPPLRVLLVEDNRVNQLVAQRLLTKDGHEVRAAASGHEALALFQTHSFDLVLMDVQMPGMDGIETTRAIRAMPCRRARSIPIIAVSAHAMKHDAERCLAAGMNGFLGKPFEIDDLRRTILFAGAGAAEAHAASETGFATVQ